MKEKIIQRVNTGSIAGEFSLDEGWSENPMPPADCKTAGMRSQFDAATGQTRKSFRHVLQASAQKKLKNRAKRQLEKIEREDKKALRAILTASPRISFYKTL
jgi:hypothetical protein